MEIGGLCEVFSALAPPEAGGTPAPQGSEQAGRLHHKFQRIAFGSSRTWATGRALPKRSKSLKDQTILLSGVTSRICGLLGPAWQLTMRVLPFERRLTMVIQARVTPGRSFFSTFHATSPAGVAAGAEGAGFSKVLKKPVPVDQLLAAIKGLTA